MALVLVPGCDRGGDEGASAPPPCGRGSFTTPDANLGTLWLWGSRLAYAPGGRTPMVCDLATGRAQVVGRQQSGTGLVSSVVASRDTVVWVDFDHPVDAALTGSPWTIRSYDLASRATRTIATGAPIGRYFTLPDPQIEWPFVVWTDLPTSGDVGAAGPDLVAYDLRDGSRRVLASRTFPDEPSITDGLVYFSAKTGRTRDLYAAPADGSAPPRAITHESDQVVTQVRARNGWVAWSLHPKASDEPVGDLPLFAMEAGGTAPRRIGTGRLPEPGRGVVVYFADTLHAIRVADGRDVVVAAEGLDIAPRWSIDDDRVAYVTVDDPMRTRKPAHVHVAPVPSAP